MSNYSGAYFQKKAQQSGPINFKPWSIDRCAGNPRPAVTVHGKKARVEKVRLNREQRIVASRIHNAKRLLEMEKGQAV